MAFFKRKTKTVEVAGKTLEMKLLSIKQLKEINLVDFKDESKMMEALLTVAPILAENTVNPKVTEDDFLELDVEEVSNLIGELNTSKTVKELAEKDPKSSSNS